MDEKRQTHVFLAAQTPELTPPQDFRHFPRISTVFEIKTAFRSLPPREQDVFVERLEEICDYHLELSDEYQARFERAEQQLAEELSRVRQPKA